MPQWAIMRVSERERSFLLVSGVLSWLYSARGARVMCARPSVPAQTSSRRLLTARFPTTKNGIYPSARQYETLEKWPRSLMRSMPAFLIYRPV